MDQKQLWDKIYGEDDSFFGDAPSHFALTCYAHMKNNNVKKVLELACGHGRDSLFFASKGLDVSALDLSSEGIEIARKGATERGLTINLKIHDAHYGIPYENNEFDAVYSHMFFSMHFTHEELIFLFSEVRRVLRPGGLHFFSVRSDKDKFYGKGRQVADGVYDVNGFELRFFSKKDIIDLMRGFNVDEILEDVEDPASLYLVFCLKT